MRLLVLAAALLLTGSAFAAQNAYLHIKANGDAQAMEMAKKGYDYYKAQNAMVVRPVQPRTAASRSDKRKQSLYFPEAVSGYYLSSENELLKIQNGKVVKRMKVRPLQDKVSMQPEPEAATRPEIGDEVLTGRKPKTKDDPEN